MTISRFTDEFTDAAPRSRPMSLSNLLARLTRWPLPALLVWVLAWGGHEVTRALAGPPWAAFCVACVIGLAGTMLGNSRLQRVIIAAGFPVSLAALGMGTALPVWIWLLPLVGLLILYPIRTWGDAPLYPTPRRALEGLHAAAPLAGERSRGGARILDAGCGVGDGLKALRSEYPHATIDGVEWSWPLVAICGLRCPWADVHQGDLWKVNWHGYDLVYLFQRPESMFRAVEKASREMRPSAYLVSLEFEAPEPKPVATLLGPGGQRVFVYRPATDPDSGKRFKPRALLTSPVPLDSAIDSDMVIDLEPQSTAPERTDATPPARPAVGKQPRRRELPGRPDSR
jgi:SAM-dependent methyltransferase